MLKSNNIYLDYAASATPNPSSIHASGVLAKQHLDQARTEVAQVLSARPSEIIFTSSGTESNNLAIQGIIYAVKKYISLPHIVTTNIEHPSVLKTCKLLEERGLAEVSVVPVEANGIVDSKKIKKAIKKNTVLVSVMYANNEIGTIQPIKEIAKEIRHYRKTKALSFSKGLIRVDAPKNRGPEKNLLPLGSSPFLHTDAVQAVNYLNLNVERLGIDLLSLSGSKIENGGRVGILYKKKFVPLEPIFGGGDQEGGLRPGTENLPEILKFSKVFAATQKIKEKESARLVKLRDYFLSKLDKFGQIIINGDLNNRLPNNVNITAPNIPSDLLVIELSAKGIMASAKSACETEDNKASYVIKAINKNIKDTDGSVRFSFGKNTTKRDIDYTLGSLSEILQKLKKWYS